MSTPVHQLDRDPRLYAPPWARERPLPVAGQPQLVSSPPVASAIGTPESNQPPRMPRGGPNVDCPPSYRTQPEFGGDVEMLAFRRKLTLEPEVVPQPPFLPRRSMGLPWISRLGFVLVLAGIISFGVSFLATSELGRLTRAEHDRAIELSAATPGKAAGEPARLVVEDGKVAANEPLPLAVSLLGAHGGEFVLLSGLEAGTRLTAGAPVGSKAWRLMARDLATVSALAPRDYVGAMDAAIDLRSSADTLLDSQVVRLEWLPKTPTSPKTSLAALHPVVPPAPTPPAPPTPAPTLKPLEPDEIAMLLRRGEQYLRNGDISSARLALRRAAAAGNATAALGVGATYDPRILQEMGVLGFAANAKEALQWYEKAAELGSTEAPRRIERLRASQQ